MVDYITPSQVKFLVGKYFIEVLNYSIKVYNYNVRNIYLPMFDMLDREFNTIISVMFDTYVEICQNIGFLIINGYWDHYHHRYQFILHLIRKQYNCYLKELLKRIHIIKLYIILLENTLKYQGWALMETIWQIQGKIPCILIRKPILNERFIKPLLLSHIDIYNLKDNHSDQYNRSPTVRYMNEVTKIVIFNLYKMIMKKFKCVTWLDTILFCSFSNINLSNPSCRNITNPKNNLDCLNDILRTIDLEIYKDGQVYKYKKKITNYRY
ncbi:hypothetical protein TCON_2157 [Astathelohania contejeani]|uniref:Maturase K n=1 Tax=Astathelohania contejeani TaxID=164912 RepID=A0ABQ7HWZ4_9MICR|nr:hypothetical protein TCON_2157 [Thelohania contejeani]